MITGKQRAYLRGLANTMSPIFQIGKNGVEETFLRQLKEALEARELIKIKVLEKSFQKLEEKRKDSEIYFNGQIYDAYSKILDIFKSVKKELIIIDSYADHTLLDINKKIKC